MMVLERHREDLCARIGDVLRAEFEDTARCRVELVPEEGLPRFSAAIEIEPGGSGSFALGKRSRLEEVVGNVIRDWLLQAATNRGHWKPVIEIKVETSSDRSASGLGTGDGNGGISRTVQLVLTVAILAAAGLALWTILS